ncbi:nicotinate-nucleotide--dimethylbenzimidazole phosphoribosyltransferase [Streptomyces sp. NBC_00249]|uniref:nicotinate-nucleotide--dimethylbenzimidazole phosphoribosyltransferase n=1 Tax=Streptomyces sp. NBC_00249 TaxID=2975690 RepID=UPI0022511789|nr:nicotinate-nucleotide--dimethylbenzimidazole phosphoribosyltransferase [Streptomyces sp. NBC_00249]MCX5197802.1 nicotinate-nucleotide--dimethylbenzimidazole phosphoribosyltransferase [Streptomyces sp. NBC_00249]
MTDTGQVPGEGHPDNAGMVDQHGSPAPLPPLPPLPPVPPQAPAGYAFQDLVDDPAEPEDEELLLMPSGQGSWSDPQVVPQVPAYPTEFPAEPVYTEYPQPPVGYAFPEPGYPQAPQPGAGFPAAPYAENAGPESYDPAAYSAGAHETGGRDTGALDLGGLVVPQPAAPVAPPVAPRRPLHMGPPVPEATGGVVRSLADRGPAAAPAVPAVAVPAQAPEPVAEPLVAEPVMVEPVAVEPVMVEPVAVEPVAVAPEPEAAPGVAVPLPVAGPGVPVMQTPAQMAMPVPMPVPVSVPGPSTLGPEYLDVSAAEVAVAEPVAAPAPQLGEIPVQAGTPWAVEPAAPEPLAAPEAEALVAAPAVAAPVAPAAVAVPLVVAVAEPVAVVAPEPEPVVEPAPEPQPEPAPVEAVEAPAPLPAPETPQPAEEAPAEPQPTPAETVAQPEPEPAAEPVEAAQPPQPEAEPAPEAVEPVAAEAAPEPAPEAAPEPEAAEPAAQTPVEAPAAEAPEAVAEPAPSEEPPAELPEAAAEAQPEVQPEPETEAAEAVSPGEPAPGYGDAEREAVLRVMRERRDIRNGFRTDPIPHEVLLRVLEAAHHAPSVGHSQPWDFVVIRSAETRRTMHELAQRQREAYAKSLPKGRAKQFKELKIEAILDTPVNIVVTADPTRGGRHTLGRHTQPQMAPYSSALAVENLWLAARAEGLGVGWVSFFDEREMVRALGLPEHLEVVAYLCVGYVDEFPEEPELAQAGWSQRRPLAWVVHEETYGRRALPGEAPHDLLSETVASIRPLDAKALGEAWERQKRMTKPAGALGMLEIISAQLAGLSRVCPPPIPEPAAVAIFAGDHGVHAQGVTPWPQEVTTQMVANFLGGGAVCNAFANQVGAEVCVIDVGVAGDLPATPGLLPRKVRPGTADLSTGPAMTREEAIAAIEVGIETARDLVAAGNKALLTGEMGIANTTVSAALISVFTGVDAAEVTGRGTGINDETHARKVEVVRRALELHQPDPADPIGVLAAIGGLEHAAIVGLLLGGASLRTPVILDGVSAGAAALVARAIAPEALSACIAGHRSAEPGHVAALNKLGLRPLIDLDLRLGEGTGALLSLPLVQSAARAMHEVATFDAAGVTEK